MMFFHMVIIWITFPNKEIGRCLKERERDIFMDKYQRLKKKTCFDDEDILPGDMLSFTIVYEKKNSLILSINQYNRSKTREKVAKKTCTFVYRHLLSSFSFSPSHHHPHHSSSSSIYTCVHIPYATSPLRFEDAARYCCWFLVLIFLAMTTVTLRAKKPGVRINANNNNNNSNKYARYSVLDELRPCRNRYGKSCIFLWSTSRYIVSSWKTLILMMMRQTWFSVDFANGILICMSRLLIIVHYLHLPLSRSFFFHIYQCYQHP